MDDILEELKKNNETLLTTEFETVFIPYQNAYCKVFYGKDKNGGAIFERKIPLTITT